MILVTGAAGKTGRAVIRALSARGALVRALVHRPQQVQAVEKLGAHEVLVGDMRAPTTMERAARGVQRVYHICPNVSPDEVTIGQVAIEAARSTGVEHFVFHSVLHPQTEDMPHHWHKLRVEEQLFKSGLPYTILQPAAYMQNVLGHWDQILEQGVYPVPYAVQTRLGLVDLQDVAEAAAVVLTQVGHAGATYELAGAEAMTQTALAALLGHKLGRPVRTQTISQEVWEQGARASGLGEYQVRTLLKMFRYYESYGFWGNPHVLGWLLGRPPGTFSDFFERVVRERSSRDVQ
jgi:uncharacterized protein YbjT (DUF2867 family)